MSTQIQFSHLATCVQTQFALILGNFGIYSIHLILGDYASNHVLLSLPPICTQNQI